MLTPENKLCKEKTQLDVQDKDRDLFHRESSLASGV